VIDLKEAARKVMGFVTDETVEASYRKCVDAAHGQPEIITMLELERKGGRCPICDMPFVRIDVENRFGKFHYYYPQCRCYKKCAKCGRDMIAERFLNITYCTECYPHGLPVPVKERKQKRKEFRRRPEDETDL
jgi:hypothetical protein